ncbi:MAG: outer membrane beta-barrel protein [Desulfobulbus sp.]|nr:outer membrane beta-barrel protein [Desulfobulbus sp.]
MKKILSVMAVSAFVMTANVAFAGGPGKATAACPEACQQQIDDLQSSQAQQNEELGAHTKQLENHEGRITALEADSAYYVRLGVRAAWMNADTGFTNHDDEDLGAGFGAAIAVGQKYHNYRFELELATQDTEGDSFTAITLEGGGRHTPDVQLTTVMGNLYYDLPIQDGFSVYGMVGIGYGYYDTDSFNYYESTGNTIAYKAGLGISYMFTDNIAGDLGYEYLGVADNGPANNVDGHNIVGSVRFMF